MELDPLDQLAAKPFDGFVVRKDLVRKYARNYPVPTYVVEFLLGRYCASTKDEEIREGLAVVEQQLDNRTVRTGREELFKSKARTDGSVKLIDIVRARLDAKNDCYLAELPSLALRDVQMADRFVKEHERMLTDGFYAEVTLGYDPVIAQERNGRPFCRGPAADPALHGQRLGCPEAGAGGVHHGGVDRLPDPFDRPGTVVPRRAGEAGRFAADGAVRGAELQPG